MNRSAWKIGVAGGLLAAGAVGWSWLHRDNTALRQQVVELRRQNETKIAARAEQERKLADQSPLERAVSQHVGTVPTSPAAPRAGATVAASPAPPMAMTRVEDLTNLGLATPATAVVTMMWAAFKGQDDELAAAFILTAEAREKAEAWRASLPPEAQAKYATPEKLVGLFFAESILSSDAALQVLETSDAGPGKALVRVRMARLNGNVSETKIPMQQTEKGWGFEIPDKAIDGMRQSAARKAAAPQATTPAAPRP
jgi:hypothetical protein